MSCTDTERGWHYEQVLSNAALIAYSQRVTQLAPLHHARHVYSCAKRDLVAAALIDGMTLQSLLGAPCTCGVWVLNQRLQCVEKLKCPIVCPAIYKLKAALAL